jgi:hypothetical protein
MPKWTPSQRQLHNRIASHRRWALEPDWRAATAPARAGRDAKFRDQVVASVAAAGIELPESEIQRRMEHLRKAHMLELAAKSAQVRAERARGNPKI